MRLMDELHLRLPFYGSRRLAWSLQQEGYAVGRTRVQRLMRRMGIEAIYPRPRTSEPHPDHRIYPYLLRDVVISAADQVWRRGHHLRADAARIHVFGCNSGLAQPIRTGVASVEHARQRLLRGGPAGRVASRSAGDLQHRPGGAVHQPGIHGRAGTERDCDQHGWPPPGFGQRVHRTLVVEREIRKRVLMGYETVAELQAGLSRYFDFYSRRRPHQSLDNQMPWDVYRADRRRQKQRNVRR